MLQSLVERSIRDEIDSRRGFVARYEALTEITCEVVVGCLRVRLCNTAKTARHSRFHSEGGNSSTIFFISPEGMTRYCRPTTSRQMPVVHSATSASLYR